MATATKTTPMQHKATTAPKQVRCITEVPEFVAADRDHQAALCRCESIEAERRELGLMYRRPQHERTPSDAAIREQLQEKRIELRVAENDRDEASAIVAALRPRYGSQIYKEAFREAHRDKLGELVEVARKLIAAKAAIDKIVHGCHAAGGCVPNTATLPLDTANLEAWIDRAEQYLAE